MNRTARSESNIHSCLIALLVFLLQLSLAFAQLPPEVARFGYADTVFVSGKVVSMDDASNSTGVGQVYQAIAVKGDRIMLTSRLGRCVPSPATFPGTFWKTP
jgi:hypothetical protein